MFRFVGIAGVGALLLAGAGCSLDSFLSPSGGTPGAKLVVASSPEMASARLQDGLTEAGIAVLSERTNGEIRMAGRTKAGKIFCLHLHGKQIKGADKTLVRVVWDRNADEEFWQMVVSLLTQPTGETHE